MDYVCEVQTRKKCKSGICIRSVITIERNEYKFRYHYREKMSISSGITIERENDYKFRYHYREKMIISSGITIERENEYKFRYHYRERK